MFLFLFHRLCWCHFKVSYQYWKSNRLHHLFHVFVVPFYTNFYNLVLRVCGLVQKISWFIFYSVHFVSHQFILKASKVNLLSVDWWCEFRYPLPRTDLVAIRDMKQKGIKKCRKVIFRSKLLFFVIYLLLILPCVQNNLPWWYEQALRNLLLKKRNSSLCKFHLIHAARPTTQVLFQLLK